VCATLPDPGVVEVGAIDDEEIEEEIEEDKTADDGAMEDARDDAMAVDNATTAESDNSHNASSFLPTLLEPLLALIQPTELSFPAPSPHPPTTSALGAIHITAYECLSNAFLALAAAPGSAASDVHAGQRVWSAVWAALVGAGSPLESVPGSTRERVWDVAVGVLWGVGTVWTGKIVSGLFLFFFITEYKHAHA